MRQITRKKKAEPTIALINIVFLMLIFFLVAGTLAQPLDGELELVETSTLDGREPPDALVINAAGDLSYRGTALPDVAAFLQDRAEDQLAQVRIVPDRALTADRLVEVSRDLREGGAQSVIIVTERALQ
ncbi:biopolymer transporter ExbD [Cognatiyoonia sp. IB215446]|uniref:ExbD/TolR family protein n=1 Tax=Cognatiyoonia sp. IB215446 TaxID=3097355 RepID=UPI002A107DE7|nr:biopolymer transporter ExbD [Cognatiyoonia sp. IB215446]MDX8350713.1 biopolymer transporter ExbD [Cognatiyoonia sp. IB215446]